MLIKQILKQSRKSSTRAILDFSNLQLCEKTKKKRSQTGLIMQWRYLNCSCIFPAWLEILSNYHFNLIGLLMLH